MSSFFETSPAREYFNRLEHWFIDLRGAPQKLSADDYQVAKAWYEAGIPFDLVQAEIEQVVQRDKQRDQELRSRLRFYCKPVERAFAERRRLQAPGASSPETPSFDLGARLRRLAERVESRLAAQPSSGGLGDARWGIEAASRVTSLSGEPEDVENALVDLEDEILRRAEGSLDDCRLADLADRRREARERLADRLPGGVPASTAEKLDRQILRRFLDLPEMSLFSMDAVPAEEDQG